MFHVEHSGDLVSLHAHLYETELVDEQACPDIHAEPALLEKFASARLGGRFSRFDVPAGEVAVPPFHGSAQQDMLDVREHAPRQKLDGRWWRHGNG